MPLFTCVNRKLRFTGYDGGASLGFMPLSWRCFSSLFSTSQTEGCTIIEVHEEWELPCEATQRMAKRVNSGVVLNPSFSLM